MSEVWKYLESDEKDPYKRGIKFEKIYTKNYLKKHHLFSKIYAEVLLWEEWVDRPFKTDIGIDLVCVGYDGKITAVQAKAYNPQSSISKPDIDSFITASNSDQFSFRLLIGTTNKIGKNAKTIINNEKRIPFQTHLLTDLEDSDFINISKNINKNKKIEKKLTPLAHQVEAIEKTTKHLKNNKKGQLIMACGSGKTLTSVWLSESIKAKRILFLAPSISLLAQTLNVWIKNSKNKNTNFLVVCSDETAGRVDEYQFVSDYDFPSTTNPKTIKDFINSNDNYVIFSTYHSSKLIYNAVRNNKNLIDITICDEAHRLTGKVSPEYGSVLKDSFPSVKKIFMTATPRIISYGIKKAAEGREIELLSMDEEGVFGKVIYELTFGEAIEKSLLADYKIIVTGISNKDLKKEEFIQIKDKTFDISTYAKAVTLKKTLKKYKLKKIITFHSFIRSASAFSNLLGLLKLNANYISGSHNIRERKQLVKTLERKTNEIEILANARVLSEGIDLPELDCIAFIDPKTSVVDIVQAVGRAIRASKDKNKIGYIVIPIFLDDNSGFETIYKTVIAMRSHDARMAEELDNFRVQMGKNINITNMKLSNLIIDLPTYVDKNIKIELLSKTIEAASETWFFWYGLLQNFIKEYGHATVPVQHFQDGFFLGKWVGHQRNRYKNNQLDEEKVDLLNSLNGWSWDPQKDTFELFIVLLKEYLETYKKMPTKGKKYKGLDLMDIVLSINYQRKLGKYNLDRIKRIESLSNLGFGWSKDEIAFNKNIKDLYSFALREGHTFPKQTFIESEGGSQLGRFTINIRNAYFDNRGNGSTALSDWQIKKIEEIPHWTWMSENEVKWNNNYLKARELLKKYSLLEIKYVDMEIQNWLFRNTTRGVKTRLANADDLYSKLTDVFGISISFNYSQLNIGTKKFIHDYRRIFNKLKSKRKLTDLEIKWIEENKKYINRTRSYEREAMKILNNLIK